MVVFGNCCCGVQYLSESKVTEATTIKQLLRDENGATAIEYAFIAAAMGLCLVPALSASTDGVGVLYTHIKELFESPVVAI
jgi:Flp pilus assembly pilin Flp